MSDLVVRVGGREAKVKRAFRSDASCDFHLREYVDVMRIDANGHVIETLERVKPGMWVYGMIELLSDQTYSTCKQRLDCLPVFYVLEILQKGAAPSRLANGSDDVDVLVLPCKIARELPTGRFRSRSRFNEPDLFVGDRPLYMPADSIIATMQAVIGPGEATPGFKEPRRVSHYATNVDEDFKPEAATCEIKPLRVDSDLLTAPYEHAAQFLELQHVAPPARKRSYTPTGRPRGRPRKHDDADADADEAVDALNELASASPTSVPSASLSLPSEIRFIGFDDDEDEDKDGAQKAPQTAVPLARKRSYTPTPVPASAPPATRQAEAKKSRTIREVFVERALAERAREAANAAPAPISPPLSSVPVSPQSDFEIWLAGNVSPEQRADMVFAEKSMREISRKATVDLSQNTWQKYKARLATGILDLTERMTLYEAAFVASEAAQQALADFCTTHLGGEFGAFVDETLNANRDATVRFLARIPEPLMFVAHIMFMRPMAYLHLRKLVRTWGLQPIDEEFIRAARELKKQQSQQK